LNRDNFLQAGAMREATYDFRVILEEYQDRVYNQAWRMLGGREDAEEAAQDAFLRIHRSLEDFRGESQLSSWIFRIVANVCITRLRRKQMQMESLDEPLETGGRAAVDSLADESPNPEEELEAGQTAENLREQVRRLPALWAQAISLHHFEGLSYEEAAEAMQIPRATVATYIMRGRQQLARQLIAQTGESAIH
jgi:RNA polymerase sigma-70 factor, ECF subfamily